MMQSLLYAKEEVRFPTSYSPTEAVLRLASNVKRPTFWMWFTHETVIGRVSRERVVLYRHRPWIHNSFIPVFTGRFEFINGQTVLVGHFSMHWFVKVFMAVWFGFLVIFSVTMLLGTRQKLGDIASLLSIPLGMAIFGVALVRFGQWLARGDREYISGIIRASL